MFKKSKKIGKKDIKNLLNKRIHWVGKASRDNKTRKVPINFDGLLSAVLSGAIPNIKGLKNANNVEDCVDALLGYLLESDDISSSHFPTLLQKKEAPNYHFHDYEITKDEDTRTKILYWLLTFYYIDLRRFDGNRLKQRVIVGIRTDNEYLEDIIQRYTRTGESLVRYFELKQEDIEKAILDRRITYYLPRYPSSAYFTLLFLLCIILEDLKYEYMEKNENITDINFETLILSNSGGNKWLSIYHPIINLKRLYNLFFGDEDLTSNQKFKFVEFLESLFPPRLSNQNIVDSYYAQLSSLAFSILVEGYLNVQKLSQIISEKISLELRAKKENPVHVFRRIFYLDYVQTKFFGGRCMVKDFENLRKQMKGIASAIGDLAKKGDTQKSLLKRIILDLKAEEFPLTFVEKLVSYLPRLEREGIKITVPQSLVTLPIREFLIIKNEFIVILWNKYAGGEKK